MFAEDQVNNENSSEMLFLYHEIMPKWLFWIWLLTGERGWGSCGKESTSCQWGFSIW
jgi:hypothetical protein